MKIFVGLSCFLLLGISIHAQTSIKTSPDAQALIEKKREYNKSNGFGYRIQVFTGKEANARKVKSRFDVTFPNIVSKLKYDAPNWKVQVGTYRSKLEADRSSIAIKNFFDGVIVVPNRD